MIDYKWHIVSLTFFLAFTKGSGLSGQAVAVAIFPDGEGEGHQVWIIMNEKGTKKAYVHKGKAASELAIYVRSQFKPKDTTLILIGTQKLSRQSAYAALRLGKAITSYLPQDDPEKKSYSRRRTRIGLDMPFPFGKHGPPSDKFPDAPGWTTRKIIDKYPTYLEFLTRQDKMGPDLLDEEASEHLQLALAKDHGR